MDFNPVNKVDYYHAVCNRTFRRKPTGHVLISNGIHLSWSGNRITIVGYMEVSGNAASLQITDYIKRSIETTWNAIFDEGYQITCTIHAKFRKNQPPNSSYTQVFVNNYDPCKDKLDSNHVAIISAKVEEMHLIINPKKKTIGNILTTPVIIAHEFGHLLGLLDRYAEKYVKGKRVSEVHTFWINSLMGDQGKLKKNVLTALFYLYTLEPGQQYSGDAIFPLIDFMEKICKNDGYSFYHLTVEERYQYRLYNKFPDMYFNR